MEKRNTMQRPSQGLFNFCGRTSAVGPVEHPLCARLSDSLRRSEGCCCLHGGLWARSRGESTWEALSGQAIVAEQV